MNYLLYKFLIPHYEREDAPALYYKLEPWFKAEVERLISKGFDRAEAEAVIDDNLNIYIDRLVSEEI